VQKRAAVSQMAVSLCPPHTPASSVVWRLVYGLALHGARRCATITVNTANWGFGRLVHCYIYSSRHPHHWHFAGLLVGPPLHLREKQKHHLRTPTTFTTTLHTQNKNRLGELPTLFCARKIGRHLNVRLGNAAFFEFATLVPALENLSDSSLRDEFANRSTTSGSRPQTWGETSALR